MSGIYTITNSINGKAYIGSAVNLLRRWNSHKAALVRGTHRNRHLQSAWNMYGKDAFVFTPALSCGKRFLIKWEQFVIDSYVVSVGWNSLYNLSPNAGSTLGLACPPDVRQKLSNALKGKKNRLGRKDSAEACRKRSEASKGNKNAAGKNIGNKFGLGYKHSVAAREKMKTYWLKRRAGGTA